MRELVYYVAVSLDGYIAGPEGEFDAFPVEGDHMVAQVERFPDAIPTVIADAMGIERTGTFDAVVMGWNTYAVGLPAGMTSPYQHLEQFVFSRTRTEADIPGEHPNLTITDEDPVDVVRRLKSQPGKSIWLCGGGQVATQLAGEIDRLVLKRSPLLFGNGIPLFAPGAYQPSAFKEVSTTAFGSGVVISEYVRRLVSQNPN
ncbi:riboflavin biosynthesis protein RibD [Arthrobacter sp. MYb23]|uniref:dihydrofolate reductase family protein n=1 Tax=unclassified Arthrobacter TaxID=235627 RepID=UPI000CFDE05C|nr:MULTISPECIES: dihydrofolate reductase family protein [unclassified Arthrobacter]PRB40615.1 riboflavin biosynthesis protein RibD [Arthrobacter sp. MYb51]PRB93986.1 riboflavin biosynthesis protein RibD [Arthrobacter sp. MYb23]